jgi:hypothetical protein
MKTVMGGYIQFVKLKSDAIYKKLNIKSIKIQVPRENRKRAKKG